MELLDKWSAKIATDENLRIIFVLFYDVHKENMFTINLEDGREAPSKARKKGAKRLEFLVFKHLFILIQPLLTFIYSLTTCLTSIYLSMTF